MAPGAIMLAWQGHISHFLDFQALNLLWPRIAYRLILQTRSLIQRSLLCTTFVLSRSWICVRSLQTVFCHQSLFPSFHMRTIRLPKIQVSGCCTAGCQLDSSGRRGVNLTPPLPHDSKKDYVAEFCDTRAESAFAHQR